MSLIVASHLLFGSRSPQAAQWRKTNLNTVERKCFVYPAAEGLIHKSANICQGPTILNMLVVLAALIPSVSFWCRSASIGGKKEILFQRRWSSNIHSFLIPQPFMAWAGLNLLLWLEGKTLIAVLNVTFLQLTCMPKPKDDPKITALSKSLLADSRFPSLGCPSEILSSSIAINTQP